MDKNTNVKPSFETALFQVLSEFGLTLPTNDDKVMEFEKGFGATRAVPEMFANPESFLIEKDNTRVLETKDNSEFDLYNQQVAGFADDPIDPTED